MQSKFIRITILLICSLGLTGCTFTLHPHKSEVVTDAADDLTSKDKDVSVTSIESYDNMLNEMIKGAEYFKYYEVDTAYYIEHVEECTYEYETGYTLGGEPWVQIYDTDDIVKIWVCSGIFEIEPIDYEEEETVTDEKADLINSLIEMSNQQIFANDERYDTLFNLAINTNGCMTNLGAVSSLYGETNKYIVSGYTLDNYSITIYIYTNCAIVKVYN